ncbi:MAG TPA: type IX secretion system membrane protein PorP/SprF [Cyclobacteriaceae bacterium]|nr:type IX secretion system membrane protein PorP/SprF [Cyclobacteriaceae bacterium]
MKKLITIFTIALPLLVNAQTDPLYNQYLFNQGMINPAYSGINNSFNLTVISRAQWAGVSGAPVTNTLNAGSSLFRDKVGVGLTVLNDQLGVNSNSEVNVSVNYRLVFTHSKLSFGMQGGVVNYRYDYSKLNTEVVDQRITQAISNFSQPNLGMGIFYMRDKFYVGFSVPRMLNVTVQDGVSSSTRYRRHLYFSTGYVFERMKGIKLKPSILIRQVEGVPPTIDLNIQALFVQTLWAGFTTRNLNTIGLIAQLQIARKLRAGYLYEYPLNSLANTNFGTHELMIGLDLGLLDSQFTSRRYF